MLSVVFDGGCDIRRLPRKKGCIGKWGLNNLLCHLNFNLIIDEARYSRFIESYFFHQIDMVVCTNYGISFFEQLLTVFPSFNFSAIASTNLRVEKVLGTSIESLKASTRHLLLPLLRRVEKGAATKQR
ncbi:uncharacterized protein LOC119335605 isoform X1 [Triticum dicoccoides]|uniref:uncharacterized protein LOC119335605 isoform X1 n=1 Tax=Triticum dicoccoides TaxID=85692 RepID=UPI00189150BA|nr:uncharacterized protein LOC119335605 isoform X1 [Triticum dicoccoides]XP_037463616.1 uncharacterized protein LOC119335605 isoform X1 [Triticum dicoccoides]XP_037463617.1 uncharacterized protein LOC119335605 isoform X1 [Triticum dicoccoides]